MYTEDDLYEGMYILLKSEKELLKQYNITSLYNLPSPGFTNAMRKNFGSICIINSVDYNYIEMGGYYYKMEWIKDIVDKKEYEYLRKLSRMGIKKCV